MNKNYTVREVSKDYAKIYYPEMFDLENIPGNFDEAYNLFDVLPSDKKPDDFNKAFEVGGDGWCDIYTTDEGQIAVFGEGALSNSYPLYIIELDAVNESIKKIDLKKLIETIKGLSTDDLNELLNKLNEDKKDIKEDIVGEYNIDTRLKTIEDFLQNHESEILKLAVDSAIDNYADGVVWLDNVYSGDLKLWGAYYSTGTTENPANIEDSVDIYTLDRNWKEGSEEGYEQDDLKEYFHENFNELVKESLGKISDFLIEKNS